VVSAEVGLTQTNGGTAIADLSNTIQLVAVTQADGTPIPWSDLTFDSGLQPGNVSAVPEPSTLCGTGIAVFLGLGYAWRRRKAKHAA
jgi:hypothetical protein